MKVVLATAPEAVLTKEYSPPLGLLYVASAIEKSGFEVILINAHARNASNEDIIEKVLAYSPDAFGITGTTENRFNIIEVLNGLKRRDKDLFTFWGGPHATLTYIDILQNVPSADVIVRGEGEIAVVKMLNAYLKKESFGQIRGLAYRGENGQVIDTGIPDIIHEIDSLPLPARHLLDFKKISASLEGKSSIPAIGVISSRGCPNDCSFCANVALGRRLFRKRDPKAFVDEIEYLHKTYGYKGFDIWDDTLTIDRKHVENICFEMLKRKLPIEWGARARVNTVDRDILSLMRKAGCSVIGFGIESGSEKILRTINKDISVDQARQAVKMSAELGFVVRCFFILSLPQEKREDVKKTIELMHELKSYGPNIQNTYNFAKIYPGTELERIALQEKRIPDGFSWSSFRKFHKSYLFDSNPTIPSYENADLSLEEIKSMVVRSNYNIIGIIARGLAKLRGIRNKDDLCSLLKTFKKTFGGNAASNN